MRVLSGLMVGLVFTAGCWAERTNPTSALFAADWTQVAGDPDAVSHVVDPSADGREVLFAGAGAKMLGPIQEYDGQAVRVRGSHRWQAHKSKTSMRLPTLVVQGLDGAGKHVATRSIFVVWGVGKWQTFDRSVFFGPDVAQVRLALDLSDVDIGQVWVEQLEMSQATLAPTYRELLTNGTFEREAGGFPVNWTALDSQRDWDQLTTGQPKHIQWISEGSGHAVQFNGPATLVSPRFDYQGQSIRMSGLMKTAAVTQGARSWCVAGAQLAYFDSDRNYLGHVDLALRGGDSDWTEYRRDVDLPRSAASVQMWLRLFEGATGAVSFDQISLQMQSAARVARPFDPKRCRVEVATSTTTGPLHKRTWSGTDISYANWAFHPSCHEALLLARKAGFDAVRLHETIRGLNVYHADDNGQPIYDFATWDELLDTIVGMGFTPLISIESTPELIASVPSDEPWNRNMPADLNKWQQIVQSVVEHCNQRYGQEEVATWSWELWNEPDTPHYFKSGIRSYLRLYDRTWPGVAAANPHTKVGGVSGASNIWTEDFLAHCARGAQLDFYSWHIYAGSSGLPSLQVLDHSIAQVKQWRANFPQYKDLPLLITEYNALSGSAPFLDTEYNAAFMAQAAITFMRHKIDRAYAFLVVDYLFSKNHGPMFNGFLGMVTKAGIPKPWYTSFLLLNQLDENELAVSVSNQPIDAVAAHNSRGDRITVILVNFDERVDATYLTDTTLQFDALPQGRWQPTLRRIDRGHNNSYRTWEQMGSPQEPNGEQRARLLDAAAATEIESLGPINEGKPTLRLKLPAHSVTLVELNKL